MFFLYNFNLFDLPKFNFIYFNQFLNSFNLIPNILVELKFLKIYTKIGV